MQIESQEGLIKLPLDDLLHPGGRGTSDMTNWTQKMRDRFHDVAGKARAAGSAAYRSTLSALSPEGAPGSATSPPPPHNRSASLAAELSTPHAPFDAYGVDGLTDTDVDDDDDGGRDAGAGATAMKLSHLHVNDTYGLQSPGSAAGAEHAARERPGGAAEGFTSGNLLHDEGGDGDGEAAAAETGPASLLGVGGEESDHDRADPDDPFSIGP